MMLASIQPGAWLTVPLGQVAPTKSPQGSLSPCGHIGIPVQPPPLGVTCF